MKLFWLALYFVGLLASPSIAWGQKDPKIVHQPEASTLCPHCNHPTLIQFRIGHEVGPLGRTVDPWAAQKAHYIIEGFCSASGWWYKVQSSVDTTWLYRWQRQRDLFGPGEREERQGYKGDQYFRLNDDDIAGLAPVLGPPRSEYSMLYWNYPSGVREMWGLHNSCNQKHKVGDCRPRGPQTSGQENPVAETLPRRGPVFFRAPTPSGELVFAQPASPLRLPPQLITPALPGTPSTLQLPPPSNLGLRIYRGVSSGLLSAFRQGLQGQQEARAGGVRWGPFGPELGSRDPAQDAQGSLVGFFAVGSVVAAGLVALEWVALDAAVTTTLPPGAPLGSIWIKVGNLGWQLAKPAASLYLPAAPLLR